MSSVCFRCFPEVAGSCFNVLFADAEEQFKGAGRDSD